MIAFSLKQLAKITCGTLHGTNWNITEVTTDTRQVTTGCLFIALKGQRFDAHDFANQAISSGCLALLVSKHLAFKIAQVVVEDTLIALGKMAAWVRQQSTAHVVALTGSSGKTSVKEMTAAILQECGETLSTIGNLNNDVGVPLTLLRLTTSHRFAVIELGANHQGEIAYTVAMTCPETVLVNNIAAAHIEGFGSLAGVAKAKGEIFKNLSYQNIAIINNDSNYWSDWKDTLKDKNVWRFSYHFHENSDFYASNITCNVKETYFTLHSPQGTCTITLQLLGRHNISNALAASALALSVGAPLSAIKNGLSKLKAIPGRLFPIVLNKSKLLLDDSYNANVDSMIAAAQTLAEMPGYRVMIVGDIDELGIEAAEFHRQVGKVAGRVGIDKVLSVGPLSQRISDSSGVGEHFNDKITLSNRALALVAQHSHITILVKGSRNAAMEQVIQTLQQEIDTC